MRQSKKIKTRFGDDRKVELVNVLTLPYPPSINSYYGRLRSGRVYIKKPGLDFRATVVEMLEGIETEVGRLRVWVYVNPPDHRRRDLDNTKKALLDALTHAGVYQDDEQIDDLRSVRGPVIKGGQVELYIWRFINEQA